MIRAAVSGAMVACALAAGVVFVGAQGPNAEVEKLADAYATAWANGDAKGIAAMFEPEGVMMGGFGDVRLDAPRSSRTC